MKTIAIIRLGRLGDVTLTSPAIKNLRFQFPGAKILLITRRAYTDIALQLPGLDHVLTFPDNGSYLDLLKLSGEIDQHHPDLIVDLHKNFRSFHLAALSKAPYKVVYHKRRRQRQAAVNDKTFVDPIPHTTDLYNQTVADLQGEIISRRPDLLIPDLPGGSSQPREGVVIVPGASSPVKAWPAARFAQVAERIIYDFSLPVTVLLGPGDDHLAAAFSSLPANRLSIHNNLPISEIVARLFSARLTITNDSGLMHISSAVGTPTVALFGPTHEQLGFYPLGLFDKMLATDEKCRPCSLHGNVPCYREEQFCFTQLGVDSVYDTAAAMLDRALTPAIFVDRDGTLIEDRHYLSDPAKISFLPGALEGVAALKKAGFKIVVISNQSGVARGFFPTTVVDNVNQRLRHLMKDAGAEPDDIRYCPHLRDGDVPEFTGDCACRKPKTGMLEAAALAVGIDLKRSIVIGDKFSDLQCGRAMGGRSLLVRTGEGKMTESSLPSQSYLQPDKISDHLSAAADYIISRS